jgi:hypothetical protein
LITNLPNNLLYSLYWCTMDARVQLMVQTAPWAAQVEPDVRHVRRWRAIQRPRPVKQKESKEPEWKEFEFLYPINRCITRSP